MVVATVNQAGSPEAAIVGFGQTKDFNIIFGTDKNSRKARNILSKNEVALSFQGTYSALQYEGTATIIEKEEKEKYAKIYFEKVPEAYKYYNLENQIYFLVKPLWLRYTDHRTQPGTITELSF